MLVSIKDIIYKSINDGGLSDRLISQEDNFIFEKRRDGTFTEIQIADICHFVAVFEMDVIMFKT
jgi:hypothetical protein